MYTLALDCGNTRIKWRVFDLKGLQQSTGIGWDAPSRLIEKRSVNAVHIASVISSFEYTRFLALCRACNIDCFIAQTGKHWKGLANAYTQVDQLGVDRWLAMVALWSAEQSGFVLISAGTACVLDVVEHSGQHLGGYIVPGLHALHRALPSKIAHQSALDSDMIALALGRSTEQCAGHGILLMTISMLLSVCQQYQTYPCYLTGGDAVQLAKLFKIMQQAVHLVPDVVFDGLRLVAVEQAEL